MDQTLMFLETQLLSSLNDEQRIIWRLIKDRQNQIQEEDSHWKWSLNSPLGPYIVGEVKAPY